MTSVEHGIFNNCMAKYCLLCHHVEILAFAVKSSVRVCESVCENTEERSSRRSLSVIMVENLIIVISEYIFPHTTRSSSHTHTQTIQHTQPWSEHIPKGASYLHNLAPGWLGSFVCVTNTQTHTSDAHPPTGLMTQTQERHVNTHSASVGHMDVRLSLMTSTGKTSLPRNKQAHYKSGDRKLNFQTQLNQSIPYSHGSTLFLPPSSHLHLHTHPHSYICMLLC